jgi:hypothetical protein
MPKSQRRSRRTTPKGTRPGDRVRQQRGQRSPSMPDQVRAALREGSPMALLQMASAFVELCTERPNDVLRDEPKRDLADVVAMFESSEQPELVLLARTMQLLAHTGDASEMPGLDDVSALHDQPAWLARVSQWLPSATGTMTDELDDGENVFVGVTWPDGVGATFVLYVDHNMGTLVKDAFVLPLVYDEVMAQYRTIIEAGQTVAELRPAEARARLEQALAQNDRTLPPIETDSWPACRPLIEWVLCRLPEGGSGFELQDWGDSSLVSLAAEIARSPAGAVNDLSADEVRQVLVPLLRMASGTAHGDPLRWSAVSVEVALLGSPAVLEAVPPALHTRVPDVVAMLVRVAHERRGISADGTMLALASLAEWTPSYLASLEKGR